MCEKVLALNRSEWASACTEQFGLFILLFFFGFRRNFSEWVARRITKSTHTCNMTYSTRGPKCVIQRKLSRLINYDLFALLDNHNKVAFFVHLEGHGLWANPGSK